MLPQGVHAIDSGWAWEGTLPEGWVPVKNRMEALREQREQERIARGSPPDQAEAA
jgi:hypothetical protein